MGELIQKSQPIPVVYECPKCGTPITCDTFALHNCFIPNNTRPAPEAVQVSDVVEAIIKKQSEHVICSDRAEEYLRDAIINVLSEMLPALLNTVKSVLPKHEAVGFEDIELFVEKINDVYKYMAHDGELNCEKSEVRRMVKEIWQAAQAAQPSTLRRDLELLKSHFVSRPLSELNDFETDIFSLVVDLLSNYICSVELTLTKLREGK